MFIKFSKKLRVGDFVTHKDLTKFGRGVIIKIEEDVKDWGTIARVMWQGTNSETTAISDHRIVNLVKSKG